MIQKTGPEDIRYEGRIFRVVTREYTDDRYTWKCEIAQRSPGTRAIIVKEDKILLTKEWRIEVNGWDYRLPGGKVYDTIIEYRNAIQHKADVKQEAEKSTMKEVLEETGLVIDSIEHIHTSHSGATIEWDLYYFLVAHYHDAPHGQQLEDGEFISVEWKSKQEVRQMCLNKDIREDRTVAVLLRYLE